MNRQKKQDWISADSLLGGALKRLGISRVRVEEEIVKKEAREAVDQLFPRHKEKIRVARFADGELVLKVNQSSPELAQEVRLRTNELLVTLERQGVNSIRV